MQGNHRKVKVIAPDGSHEIVTSWRHYVRDQIRSGKDWSFTYLTQQLSKHKRMEYKGYIFSPIRKHW
jgi:hypothetical protein